MVLFQEWSLLQWLMHVAKGEYLIHYVGSRPAEKMYQSYFEDDYGNKGIKEISRSELAHLLYDYLPLIDEHNNQRQKIWA